MDEIEEFFGSIWNKVKERNNSKLVLNMSIFKVYKIV